MIKSTKLKCNVCILQKSECDLPPEIYTSLEFFHVFQENLKISWNLVHEKRHYLLLYSIYKHDAINIANPSSMRDAHHMSFIIDLVHCRVSVAQWWCIGVQNLKVWGLIPQRDSGFFLCPMLMTRQKTTFSISLLSSKLAISLILFTNNMLQYAPEEKKFWGSSFGGQLRLYYFQM